MHPPQVRAEALALIDAGLNDCEISRRLGVPRGTIRNWRNPTYMPRNGVPRLPGVCPRCWGAAKPIRFTAAGYAELLALYLGDGSISRHPRTHRLGIILDDKYPDIINDTRELLERSFPENDVHIGPGSKGKCSAVSVYSTHLVCLFPQHGPGPKHKRRILLEPWQQEVLEAAPWSFLRGCIRSDGSVFVNRTGAYEYLSYDFANSSDDIAHLFTKTCEGLGLRPRATKGAHGGWRVRINRRDSVELMREHISLKS